MTTLTEADIEEAALEWLAALGWHTAHGPDIGPGRAGEERTDYGAVVLERRLRDALARLNPDLPREALDDAFRSPYQQEGADDRRTSAKTLPGRASDHGPPHPPAHTPARSVTSISGPRSTPPRALHR